MLVQAGFCGHKTTAVPGTKTSRKRVPGWGSLLFIIPVQPFITGSHGLLGAPVPVAKRLVGRMTDFCGQRKPGSIGPNFPGQDQ